SADVDAFWRNLHDGVEGITFFTDDELRAAGESDALLARPDYVRARGALEDIDRFDATFFGFTLRDAELMDPQFRLFLETSWKALETAGYDSALYPGSIGVYGGATFPSYLAHHMATDATLLKGANMWHVRTLNENDHLTTHVSYRMGLRGPSVNVQTACSTSLVAVHTAAQAVVAGECDMALAGGVSVSVPSRRGYLYAEGHILSPDGHCRAFDADAAGTVEGEGVGVVVLKRLERALEDGDPVLAVILATATNNDGQLKAGYTAPSIDGQADVIAEAQSVAGVSPDTISYVETHGTGTALGDPIEIAALRQVFRAGSDRVEYCALGAVKTSIGHLDAAAGIAGLIKTVQALRHRAIPPTLHFRAPNPRLELEASPFFVNGEARPWEVPAGTPRRAGVSSFGIGGTNAHAVLEEAPPREGSGPARPWHLLVLSARSPAALEEATDNLVSWLREHPDANLADVAYTLQVGRRPFKQRRTVICRGVPDAIEALESLDPARVRTDVDPHRMTPLVYLFPGQGAQHPGMAREAYHTEPVFRAEVDRCCELLRPRLGLDLREVIFPPEGRADEAGERLRATELAQPALFVVEYALARLWMHWGAVVEAMVGHSIGEYVAACLAGVLSLDDALEVVAARGALMAEMPAGAMLSVALGEAAVREILPDTLDVAAVNGPSQVVVAGEAAAVDAFHLVLEGRGIESQRLHTSHAFHSRMMDPVVDRFREVMRGVELRAPELPFLSNVTGGWITEAQARDPDYWAAHLRGTVRFADNVDVLMEEPERILLEVGPGRSLATLARRHPARQPWMTVLHSLPHARDDAGDTQTLLAAVAELWLVGMEPRWPELYTHEHRHRVPLPTYPFRRGRFWLGVRDAETLAEAYHGEIHDYPVPLHFEPRNEQETVVGEIFRELFGVEKVSIYANFFHMGGDSLLAVQLARRIRERFGVTIPLKALWEARTVAQFAALVASHRQPENVAAGA
ncbi:MAG TPA: beta-ketoacyl synthase N-terminal-like domain-containing protein, partial [Longimicrobium sp.]|nr:beta-ketoacyl synthase N-terminal-like domain-containing protein [Longimicrobium sp.]